MKKKIRLLLGALAAALCLAGCSGKEEAAYDKDMLTSVADVIITNFSQMTDTDFASFENATAFQLDYTMLQIGLKISGEDFLGIINAWKAAEQECGNYISHGDYDVEVKADEYVVSTVAEYDDREATMLFTFDKNMAMKSLDVSAKISIGEILSRAGLNTLLGMGTVFVVLIFLAFIISLFRYVPVLLDKQEAAKKPALEEAAEAKEADEAEETDDTELAAVIAAAIAAAEGTDADGFVVRSIRRRPSNNWK